MFVLVKSRTHGLNNLLMPKLAGVCGIKLSSTASAYLIKTIFSFAGIESDLKLIVLELIV